MEINLNKEERMSYDSSLKAKWDYENVLDYVVKTAVKTAVASPEEKVREESKIEFFKNLLLNTDFDVPKVAMLAEVREEMIVKIQQELKNNSWTRPMS